MKNAPELLSNAKRATAFDFHDLVRNCSPKSAQKQIHLCNFLPNRKSFTFVATCQLVSDETVCVVQQTRRL